MGLDVSVEDSDMVFRCPYNVYGSLYYLWLGGKKFSYSLVARERGPDGLLPVEVVKELLKETRKAKLDEKEMKRQYIESRGRMGGGESFNEFRRLMYRRVNNFKKLLAYAVKHKRRVRWSC